MCLMFNNFTFYSPIRCLYSMQLNDDGRENADKTFQFNILHQSCIKVHCPALVLQCCSASNDALECRVCSGWRERPAPGPGRDQRLQKHQHLLFQLYIYKPVCQSSGLRSYEVALFQLSTQSILAADLNTSMYLSIKKSLFVI